MNDWAAIAEQLRVKRSTVFQLWGSGQLGSVTIGRRRFSTDRQIADFIRRLEMNAEAAAEGCVASAPAIDPQPAGALID